MSSFNDRTRNGVISLESYVGLKLFMFCINTELCLYSVELILLYRLQAIFKKAQIISLHWNFSLSIMICRAQASSFLVMMFVLIGGIWGSRDGENQTVSSQ